MKIAINGDILDIRGPSGPDGNPIGTVISLMGTIPPKDYLACDGTVYNISQHPELARFFAAQFGSANYFGGDGETTFAVPDMRNLFLRGHHGGAEERLSGEIGERQDATQNVNIGRDVHTDNWSFFVSQISANPGSDIVKNADSFAGTGMATVSAQRATEPAYDWLKAPYYTARPVNMAVLYCIKAVETSQTAPPALLNGVSQEQLNEALATKQDTLTGTKGQIVGFNANGQAEAQNSLEVYSTEETRIGTWIDGKPLYRRTYKTTTPQTTGTALNIMPVPSWIDALTNIYGVFYVPEQCLSINCFADASHYVATYIYRKNVVQNISNALYCGCPMAVTLEYTKTTDQAAVSISEPASTFSMPANETQFFPVTASDTPILTEEE